MEGGDSEVWAVSWLTLFANKFLFLKTKKQKKELTIRKMESDFLLLKMENKVFLDNI